ncbi:ATP-binding cassette domain-containing protein [candidate division KSB1 bacterium]|nr:ATP-binding cassette domain-containing protein [candidate division KSB1 bacterium]
MIQIQDLKYQLVTASGSSLPVLNGINLTIQPGESLALMGANGSGKTTLVRCLNGLIMPTSGKVVVDQLEPTNANLLFEIRKRVGLVFQNPENQIVSSTVEREIAFGLENIGMPRPEMQQIVETMLAQFDLIKYRKRPPHLLSGGEKQRLAIAAVLAMQPRYLILDEPTSLLDPLGREMILQMLQRFHTSEGADLAGPRMTTLLVTQFPEEALLSDRLLVMARGQILMDGPPRQLFLQLDRFKELGLGVPLIFEMRAILARRGFQPEQIEAWLQ